MKIDNCRICTSTEIEQNALSNQQSDRRTRQNLSW